MVDIHAVNGAVWIAPTGTPVESDGAAWIPIGHVIGNGNGGSMTWTAIAPGDHNHLADAVGTMRTTCPACRALWDHRMVLLREALATRLDAAGLGQALAARVLACLDAADADTVQQLT